MRISDWSSDVCSSDLMAATGANCWLVNTGWTGGAYGTGERMKIAYTRAMVRAALGGGFSGIGVAKHPQFGLLMPESCPNVPSEVLNLRTPGLVKKPYDSKARNVPNHYRANFTHTDTTQNRKSVGEEKRGQDG